VPDVAVLSVAGAELVSVVVGAEVVSVVADPVEEPVSVPVEEPVSVPVAVPVEEESVVLSNCKNLLPEELESEVAGSVVLSYY